MRATIRVGGKTPNDAVGLTNGIAFTTRARRYNSGLILLRMPAVSGRQYPPDGEMNIDGQYQGADTEPLWAMTIIPAVLSLSWHYVAPEPGTAHPDGAIKLVIKCNDRRVYAQYREIAERIAEIWAESLIGKVDFTK